MRSRTARHMLGVLGVVACTALLVVPTSVGAQSSQDGPQFGNWGPGMSPPDQEGADTATPSTGSSGGQSGSAPYGYAAPNAAAPAPPGAVAPLPIYNGCQYDLQGAWWNDGRQTTPGYRTYSAYVYVRQYRSWIQGQQDDGTSYYGRCLGSRLMFDVYNGYTYIGRQSGTISGGYAYPGYPGPIPWGSNLYDSSAAPYSMPAVTVPISPRALRASFTWSSFYGSGSETWAQSYGGPIPPLPILAAPGTTASATPIPPAATPAPPPATQGPHIDALTPPRGPYGMEVIINGSGFASDNNLITFGPATGLTRPDGSPGNLIARVGSTDGRTLRFTVPRNGPSGILCDASGSCIGVSAALLQPGSYDVAVTNASGASNSVTFEITADANGQG